MTQLGFYFDNSRCTGCRTCTMACKDYNDMPEEINLRRVFDYEGGECVADADGVVTTTTFAYHVSAACNHCTNPACVANCPTGAMQKREDGIVWSDPEVCIGCGSCANSCPYGVPKIQEDVSKSRKCNYCMDRIDAGLRPICVEACPLRALDCGDIDELRAKYPDAGDMIAPLADPSMTGPNTIIKACPAAKPVNDTEGMIANELEVAGEPAREITVAAM